MQNGTSLLDHIAPNPGAITHSVSDSPINLWPEEQVNAHKLPTKLSLVQNTRPPSMASCEGLHRATAKM